MNNDFSPTAQRDRDTATAEEQKQRIAAAKADLQWVMGDARGRRVMTGLLVEAGVYRTSMATDPNLTAFNEGGRNAGLKLLARLIDAAPEAYLLMEKERVSNGTA